MAKLIKTIKQYEEVCSQCGNTFNTYYPEKETLCYGCTRKKDCEVHNIAMSQMHRDLLQKKVTISNLALRTCSNKNFFNYIQLSDEEGNVITIDVRSEVDYEDDAYVFHVSIKKQE